MISEPESSRPAGGFDSFCRSAFSSVCKRESGTSGSRVDVLGQVEGFVESWSATMDEQMKTISEKQRTAPCSSHLAALLK